MRVAGTRPELTPGARWRHGTRGIFPWALLAGVAYRGPMGRLLLILLAVIVVVMVVSLVISALHFLFWIAVLAVVLMGVLRLTAGRRRRTRR